MTFNVELPAPLDASVTDAGFRLVPGPDGDTVADRLTVPENPPRLVSEIVDVPDEPWIIFSEEGFADIAKSGLGGCATVTVTLVEWESDPLVPVTVAV